MSPSPPEFIATYWTLAGDVVPLGPPEQEASPHDFRERVATAARLGYAGVGLMHSDLMRVRQRYGWREIAGILDDHGMKHLELEFLVGWMADGEELAAARATLEDLLEAARHLDVRHLKVGPDMQGSVWPLSRMAERFAGLCRAAAEHGTGIVLEPMPWSNVADLDSAIAIVEGAGEPNGGLLLDVWHVARGGIPYEAVSAVPAGLIHHVELDDADAEIRGTLIEDTLDHRRFCGDGDLDVVSFLRALDAQGYDGPYGIEILSAAERRRPFCDTARDAIETARRELARRWPESEPAKRRPQRGR